LASTAACAEFSNFMFPDPNEDANRARTLGVAVDDLDEKLQALRTDGAIAVKNGRIVYEHYVGPYQTDPTKRHGMWSATKSFTTGLFGAIAQQAEPRADGGAPGPSINLSTRLGELTDTTVLNSDARIADITIEQLLSMAPNFVWNEGYDGDISTSNVVRMLWLDGPRDMMRYVAGLPFGPEGPGNRFNYSSANTVMAMAALKNIYGTDYDRMPWNVLFDRLGMSSVVFERDETGTFVASSYAHMTLRDMARFGYAYLNGGYFGGEQVIHPEFVRKARQLGLGMRASGTTDAMIDEEQGFYSMGFWINADPLELKASGALPSTELTTKYFPSAPTDMFFAAGHYGQNILIFPQDDLMIVRMSHDSEYWSKLDRMMSTARACFNQ
jgi:CubicO group peptidase (beta-lactamase class C family)